MPEGDSLHRAARRLQALVGERVMVETPHPRAASVLSAERLDGRRLEAVEAVGKNLLLSFEGGLVLRSHLRMTGRWQVVERGAEKHGRPWLVLTGTEREAVLWNGPVLELTTRGTRRLRPAMPALRDDDSLPRPGRRQPHRLLVPRLPERRGAAGRVVAIVAVRAPHLYRSLRCFCLAGFSLLADDVARGDELPFAFEEHA